MLQTPKTRQPVVNRLVVIGLGLIGSSLALAARNAGLATEVVGISRRSSTLDLAVEMGVIDRPEQGLAAIASELGAGDLVVIGVPTLTVPAILKECFELLSDQVTITDVASVKGSVMVAAEEVYGHLPVQLVPGHPIAGSEKSGVTAAKADLFKDHRVILTPHADSGDAHVQLVEKLWQKVGAVVSCMDIQEHDEVLAATSHLPHFLAYSLVDTLASMRDNREIFRYAAGGFRDFTRIAASDPTMWRDVFLTNKDATLEILGRFTEELFALQRAIRTGDGEMLHDYFTRTRAIRRGIIDAGQDTDAPDFGRKKS